ncbi:hypothetical protein EYC80_005093 [Monilinia laxa]|uniref:Uncharacterized protein n=1 Tax=Monilinia laxa TaxID=61186 RepID=A0A5N6KKH8_MONLA|nr:hypothetical protein EYC80_005093 [Monilinia laxa]
MKRHTIFTSPASFTIRLVKSPRSMINVALNTLINTTGKEILQVAGCSEATRRARMIPRNGSLGSTSSYRGNINSYSSV